MKKPKLRFELVPVELAKKMAELEDLSTFLQPTLCAVCATPVDLQRCKTDEHGTAVHEKCYLHKVTREKQLTPPRYSAVAATRITEDTSASAAEK